MELSTFTVKLFILFIPGLLAFIIIDNLSIHKVQISIHMFELINNMHLGK